MSAPAAFSIQGREITMPVEVRKASSWAAIYPVDARAAQRLVDPAGLRVVRPFPNRALATLLFVRYDDGDLDAYHEVGVSFLVHPHEGARASDLIRNRARVYIHHLPVNQGFTLEAGREIWGYPKFLADIDIDEGPRETACAISESGSRIFRLEVRNGGAFPMPAQAPPTYTFLDGVLRLTEWEVAGGSRGRPGGARLELGDHPIADELRTLGLPERALLTATNAAFRARFGAARVVRAAAGEASPRPA